jgi:DNA repair exonuclease SbcCD ATPase subunit
MELETIRKKLSSTLMKHKLICNSIAVEKAAIAKGRQEESEILSAQSIVQTVAESVQQQAHTRIAKLVSKCLYAIYQEDAYEFVIEFDRKRGKTEANLTFVKNTHRIDPRECGGQLDIASLALRLSCLMLSRPSKRRILFLDEPCRFVDKYRIENVRTLLLTLAKEMDFQIVLTTHNVALQTGKVVEIETK